LTVPPHAPASPPSYVALQTILCPIDFSSAALEAFGFALDLARRADASVVLVNAIEFLAEEEPLENAHFNVPEFRVYLLEDARQRLQSLVSRHPPSTAASGPWPWPAARITRFSTSRPNKAPI